MATIFNMVVVAQDETSTNVQRDLIAETSYRELAGLKLTRYFKSLVSGMRNAIVQTKVNMAKASGTITLASLADTNTITINGIAFTAVTTNATGPLQFNLMANDTQAAAQAVTAFNAHTTLDGMVIATSSTTVITITALVPGELGNAVTTAISANGSVSGARLTGGTNGDVERSHNYGSAS